MNPRERMVVDSWNAFASVRGLPKVKSLSSKRKTWISRRYKAIFSQIEDIYAAIDGQAFLTGCNDRHWRITFDFLWRNDDNYVKILEYHYGDKRPGLSERYTAMYAITNDALGLTCVSPSSVKDGSNAILPAGRDGR